MLYSLRLEEGVASSLNMLLPPKNLDNLKKVKRRAEKLANVFATGLSTELSESMYLIFSDLMPNLRLHLPSLA